ncbi:MAG: C69 family dipeptidase [Erysipelotrichaceae bacterium]|nr:C69 family dipeptidase [Erysipelotrichaceae bacterium]MDY6034224.1 C69 family dipeptidase [Bulleidia sp.]
MKKYVTKLLSSTIAILVASSSVISAYACTGVIIGGDLTEDGSTIFGRTEDLEVNHNKVYKVHPAGEYKAGDTVKDVSVDPDHGYSYTFTHDSYRYTSISDTTPEYGYFDETGFNEKGLIADMTVSASANDSVLEVDPYVEEADENHSVGISEAIITTAVLGSCDSARNAVEFISQEVATKGASEGNGLVVADASEVWYMEIYTGHQFVAMKYPRDKFSVFPNSFWLNECNLTQGEETDYYNVSQDGNYIYSKDIFKVAQEAKTFKGDEENRTIDLYASYALPELSESNVSRVCSGIKQFNPDADLEGDVYEFLQTTNKKITLADAMAFTRNRLESINKIADDLGRGDRYPIGNRNTMEAHIYHIPSTATQEYPGTMWLALGSPLTSPFVAYYPNQQSGIEQAQNETNEYDENSVYWLAMDTLFMVEYNREQFQPIVSDKISALENEELQNAVTSVLSADQATMRNQEDAQKAYETMKEIHEEIQEKFKEYIHDNDYTIQFIARRATAPFAKTEVLVPKDSAEIGLKLQIQPDPESVAGELQIVDHYGNPVDHVNKELTYSIPTSAFDEEVVFMDGDQQLTTEVEDDKYVFTTSATHITYKAGQAQTPQASKTTPKSVGLLVGAVVVVAIAATFIRKKARS